MLLAFLIITTIAIPPAAKVLAISITVYAALQGLKRAPWFNGLLTGWWSIAFNVLFSIVGVLVTVPADTFYSVNTLLLVLQAVAAAAGIHGTVLNLQQQSERKKEAAAVEVQTQLDAVNAKQADLNQVAPFPTKKG